MNIKKLKWIACSFLVLSCIGCTTKTSYQVISGGPLEAMVEHPSISPVPLESGDTIVIDLKKEMNMLSKDVRYLKMIVRNAANVQLTGELISVRSDGGKWDTGVKGRTISVSLGDVKRITKTIKSIRPVNEFVAVLIGSFLFLLPLTL